MNANAALELCSFSKPVLDKGIRSPAIYALKRSNRAFCGVLVFKKRLDSDERKAYFRHYPPFILRCSSINPPFIFHNITEDERKNNGE
jgi:hypothetical protein